MLRISLLGVPTVVRDDVEVPLRGRKAWGLLAYLVCAGGPHSREHLAGLLFDEAADPLGTLRWNLAEIRRVLRAPDALRGSVIRLHLPDDAQVDVRAVLDGAADEALASPGLGRDLLEGLRFDAAGFDAWLTAERRHLRMASGTILREAALQRLGEGAPQDAIDLAARLVAGDPLDEPAQALLIRAYAQAGDRTSAARQLAACIELFRRELGIEPGAQVISAVDAGPVVGAPGVGGVAAARAQLEAGSAAMAAGAVEAGIACLRRAVAESAACGDRALNAQSLAELGSALVNAVRGSDDEAAITLHRAVAIAEDAGRRDIKGAAYAELAHLESLAGRYERALRWIDLAEECGASPGVIAFGRGACLSEVGSYDAGLAELGRAIGLDDPQAAAAALSERCGMLLLLQRPAEALADADAALAALRAINWTAFLPFPEVIRGLALIELGRAEEAREPLQHAFALGCQIGDPCWEGMGAFALGVLAQRDGDLAAALAHMLDARERCTQRVGVAQFIRAWALDGLCGVALAMGHPDAGRWVDELAEVASAIGARAFVVRAHVHRVAMGGTGAVEAARVLVEGVHDPALRAQVEALAASV